VTDQAIETENLTKRYGGKIALDRLNLTVPAGDVFGLLGHNGAGKTTTVSLLTTLLRPTEGRAYVWGMDVVNKPREVQRCIGYLPENVQFYDNLTLMENLVYFARLSDVAHPANRAEEVLEVLNFTGHERQKLASFSKGMRQRVGIAQAILHRPRVLFLDEPTSGLDPQGVRVLRETVRRLNREMGITVFMNTHVLTEVTHLCTSIGILRAGHLIYHDSLKDTLDRFAGDASLEDIYLHIDESGAGE
jgi:ABC-2 type transport system ATP-binding protein